MTSLRHACPSQHPLYFLNTDVLYDTLLSMMPDLESRSEAGPFKLDDHIGM